jgi:NADPH-dependent 2,4-dienoyl-CoA reductase/sulfur reductase-like enzyme
LIRTLVGSGLRHKSAFRRQLASLIPGYITHLPENVKQFSPSTSSVVTTSGRAISYDLLVVATGLQTNWSAIEGLQKALVDPSSGVSSIYSYDTCDKVWNDLEALRSGNAVFTQPAGIIKCAGGKQIQYTPAFLALTYPHKPRRKLCGWLGIGIAELGEVTTSKSTFTLACPPCLV